jgi:polysaccharide biosynthesis/export protein
MATRISTQAPTMARIAQMMHNLLHVFCITETVLLMSISQTGVAQINMQQMPGYVSGNTLLSPNRNKTDAPVTMQTSGLMVVPEDLAKLRLAPGFLVGLNVLDDPDFTGSFRIDENGDLVLPILGTLHAAGSTASTVRSKIRDRLLDNKIMKDPQVILTVLEYTAPEVTIIGEVASPGKYPLLVPRKLVNVLALAGGPTLIAGNEIQITSGSTQTQPVIVHYSRGADSQTIENIVVNPGDTVQVKRAGIVYVLGAVNRPGGYVMQEEGTLNVLQAISLANGTSISASTGTIYLLHKKADGTEVDIAIPYKKMIHGNSANVQLHATDVLFVPTSTMKAILTNSQGIIASAASASIYAVAVH